MKWLVTELQTFENGAMSTPSYAYDTQLAAEAKYHSVLSSAAGSKLPTHAAVLMTSEGVVLESKAYFHESEGA
jgi:hypothetical protein